jgi:thiosulfate dehydrogenase [quinone] large subunit
MEMSAPLMGGESQTPRLSGVSLAVLRVGIAVLWIQNASWKVPPDFGQSADKGLYFWASQAVEYPVLAPYSAFVETIVLPNIAVFGWVTLLTEAALGAFLLIGLATRFWALVGIAQTIAITLSVLNAPHEWHWSYVLMLLAHVVLLGTAAGRHFGLDGVFRPVWQQSSGRLSAILMRAS